MAVPKLQLLSKTLYDTDGSTTVWDFNFEGGYILQDHIKAYTETPAGLRTPIVVTPGMLIGPWQLQITPALAAGNVLVIYRATPKDAPMVDFVDRGGVSEVALDTVARQAIFVAAEASDDVATSNIDAAVEAASDAAASAVAAAASAASVAGQAAAAQASADNAAASALEAATAAGSLTDLQGSTVVGRAVLKAADQAAARMAIGAAGSGANTDITSLTAPELGAATATTQAGNDNTTKVATTAQVQAALKQPGQVLQVQTYTDTGGTASTPGSYTNVTASFKNFTPRSTNSTIIVECMFNITVGLIAAANTYGYAVLYDNVGAITFGTNPTFGVANSPGGNSLATIGMCAGALPNSALTVRQFSLRAQVSNSGQTVQCAGHFWKITEVQN